MSDAVMLRFIFLALCGLGWTVSYYGSVTVDHAERVRPLVFMQVVFFALGAFGSGSLVARVIADA